MTSVSVREGHHRPGAPTRADLNFSGDWEGVQDHQLVNNQRSGTLLVPNGNGWVEHDTLGVAEEVARLWPNLRVMECRQRCRNCAALGHYPYTVAELTRDGRTVPVLGFLRLDREVIDTLWSISSAKHDTQKLADEHNARVRRDIANRQRESQQAALEVVGAALKSNKFDWRGPGGVKVSRTMSREEARRALTQ